MSDWISVEDRIPELGVNVMTVDNKGRIYLTHWTGRIFKLAYAVFDHKNVTHWMPLPEPPSKQQKAL